MNICILMGSPRRNGNTIRLVRPFIEELESAGHTCGLTWLYDLDLRPCTACRTCQQDWTVFGCRQKDDMQEIFDSISSCGLLILATPIYSWYCTPPMKAVMDRMVYGMNKYYGKEKGPALWAGKKIAVIATCGYRPEQGADLFEEGIRRYCRHSRLSYLGMLAERDYGYQSVFMDPEKELHVRAFARELLTSCQGRLLRT